MGKRNANGLGSIKYNDRRKRWEARITVGSEVVERDQDGKATKWRQVRKLVTASTQKEVAKRMERLKATTDVDPTMPDNVTTARFLEYWLHDVLPQADISDVTREGYERIVRLYVVPMVGRVQLADLSPAHVRKMITSLRDQGLSPNTQRQARSVLRRALRTAEVDGLVNRNVAKLADGVKVGRANGRTLTPEQARALLNGATGSEFGALLTVLLSLGLRKGEALGLSWDDLELDTTPARLSVRKSLKIRTGGSVYLDEPKTAGSRRTLHVPAPVVAELRRHRAEQNERRLAFGTGWGGKWVADDLVFTSSVGTPLDPNRVNREVKRLTTSVLGQPWTPHEMRHSAASILMAQGVPLKTVSETLGHSSIRVTADVYGHLMEPARTEAADAMTGALWGAS